MHRDEWIGLVLLFSVVGLGLAGAVAAAWLGR